jgi:parvulin-like peptidyl-prolyl isomerase
MNIEDYYLDLKKVSFLPNEDERQNIHKYYRDLMNFFAEGRDKEAQTLMNTLVKAGYLKNITEEQREEKIETILG